jgi:citrate lyase beta subunit
MEDGVVFSKKDDARQGILHALANVDFGRTERLVRINGFETGDLAFRDLDAVLKSPVLPDGIVIPKVEVSKDVVTVSQELDALGDRAHDVCIICMIESACALLNITSICTAYPERMDAVILAVMTMCPMLVLLEPRLEKNWNSQGIMFLYMLLLMA